MRRRLLVYDAGPLEAEDAVRRLPERLPEGALLFLSGFVLDALETNPGRLAALAAEVERAGAELLGGALYSAYLPLLPERDAAWQLSDMAERIEELFGLEVEGAYLSDGAFDLTLVPTLAEEGYRYALLPNAALSAPTFVEVEEAGLVLYPHDGTSAELSTPDPNAPFPAAAIEGATHPKLLPRLCPGAKDLYAKMRWVSDKLEEAHRPPEVAYQALYRGQWGVAYRGASEQARRYAHRQLIAAENHCDPRKYAWVETSLEDIDGDGHAEAVLESHVLAAYLRPAEGGLLVALDLRDLGEPLIRRRSLGLYFAADERRLPEQPSPLNQVRFDASRYRERVHLVARGRLGDQPVEVKKSFKLKAKRRRLEVELRVRNLGEAPLGGVLGVDVWPFLPIERRPELRIETAPEANYLALSDGGLYAFPLEIPPERARRLLLAFEVAE